MKRIRILLADDHEEILKDVRSLLESDFDVVGAVADGAALVTAAKQLNPDVIVAEISMPQLNGIEAAIQIFKVRPDSRIIFLTIRDDPSLLAVALVIGVSGYVLKSLASEELACAIREVFEGRGYISPSIENKIRIPRLPQQSSFPITPVVVIDGRKP